MDPSIRNMYTALSDFTELKSVGLSSHDFASQKKNVEPLFMSLIYEYALNSRRYCATLKLSLSSSKLSYRSHECTSSLLLDGGIKGYQ